MGLDSGSKEKPPGGAAGVQARALPDLAEEREVRRWADTLNLLDSRASAQALIAALNQAARGDLPIRKLYAALEVLGPPALTVVESLQRHHVEVRFPLAERIVASATLLDDLCHQLILGYSMILRGIHATAANTSGETRERLFWARVAHRIAYFSSRSIIDQRLLNRAGRQNLWLRLNKLYLTALKLQLHHQPVDFPGIAHYPDVHLERLYKGVLLLSLAPLHALRKGQLEELLQGVGVWAGEAALRTCKEGRDRTRMPFHVNPTHDCGPVAMSENCIECVTWKCLLLDTAALRNHLAGLISQAKGVQEERVCLSNGAFVSVATLNQLLACWRDRVERIDPRKVVEQEQEVEIIHTLRGIHRHLGEGLAEIDMGASPVTEAAPSDGEGDGGSPASASAAEDPWLQETEGEKATIHRARLRDISESGFGVEVAIERNSWMRVGDLVGISLPGEPVQLGVVRWIRDRGQVGTLGCGMLLIGHRLRPASIAAPHGEGEASHRCLLALHRASGKSLLIIDYFPLLREKPLTLVLGRNRLPIAFSGWPVEESSTFEGFEFCLREASESGFEGEGSGDRPILSLDELPLDVGAEDPPGGEGVEAGLNFDKVPGLSATLESGAEGGEK